MVGIDSHEGKPSVCGAFVRRWWLAGGDTRKNACGNSRRRPWSLQAAPVVTPGRAVPPDAWATSRLSCLNTERASVDAGTPARGATFRARAPFTVPRVPPLHAPSCTPPRRATPRALARSAVKRGDRRELPGLVGIRRRLPKYAQCPSARRLGTVGAMIHATQNARERTRPAGSVSPMQGHHEAQSHYPRASDGERRVPRASVAKRRGILRSVAPPQTRRATPVRDGSQL